MLVFSPAQAQQRWVQYAFGTGFYINREGDVVTNAHVVRQCESITIRTPQGDRPATLVASDATRDLAILRTQATPAFIAPLRWNIEDLKIGDTLYMYGFPGAEGAKGTASFVRTTLSAMHGPAGQPEWLQLETPSQQGNSGGPVLDASGNVIAVVSGRAEVYEPPTTPGSEPKLIRRSGIAITMRVLQEFLDEHMAGFYQSASGMVAYAEPVIRQNAQQFIFPVACRQGTITR